MTYYLQHGQGLHDIKILRTPYRVQHGRNFYYKGRSLGFLSKIAKMLFPYVKRAGKAIGKEALSSGIRMINDTEENPEIPLTDIIKKRTKQSVRNLSEKAVQQINKNVNGEGLTKRKRKRKNENINTKKLKMGMVERNLYDLKPCKSKKKKNKNSNRSKDLFDDPGYN